MRRKVFRSVLLLYVLTVGFSCEGPDKHTQQQRTNNAVAVQPSAEDLNTVLTSQAWEAYNRGDYKAAIESADRCINEFLGRAMREQEELEAKNTPLPPIGAVSDQERQVIFARGLLNDVATCLYIRGRSLEAEGKREEAGKVYERAAKYTYARCWDPKGWFWSPSEGARDRLRMLK